MSFITRFKENQQNNMLSLLICVFLIVAALITFGLELSNKQVDVSNLRATLDPGGGGTSTSTNYYLVVRKGGTGSGTIIGSPSSINCGQTCYATLKGLSAITLYAVPDYGSTFGGWDWDCVDSVSNSCRLTMDSTKTALAYFDSTATSTTATLSLTKFGNGEGTVASNPYGISCQPYCYSSSAKFTRNASVTLTATPKSGSVFSGWGWGGACSGTSQTCIVSMTNDATAIANFNTATSTATSTTATLSLYKLGSGRGTVTSNPAGIYCVPSCVGASSSMFTKNTYVTLSASPTSDSVFAGWSGACSGTNTNCSVAMTSSRSVYTTFNTATSTATSTTYTLSLTKFGNGEGTVASNPYGISCQPYCYSSSAKFTRNASVTLTATPKSGSVFSGWGWGGACSGTSQTCIVSMTNDATAIANFNTATSTATSTTYTLNVSKSGTGSVASVPSGINCGNTCSASFNRGTPVTLIAIPGSGYTFAGWSGSCSGTGTCTVTMTSAKSVTATFLTSSVVATWYPCNPSTCTSSSSCGYIKGSITRTCPAGKTVQTGMCVAMPNNHVEASYKSGNGWYCKFHCNSSICWTSDGCALVQCK